MIIHPIAPVFDANSRILILGSFPSVRSREVGFYYGHPQNRFWRLISDICGEALPYDNESKTALLLNNGIALWDVIGSCEITGSSDTSIRNVKVNDISIITNSADIKAVFLNGKTAEKYFAKYVFAQTEAEHYTLPSTSPANAAYSYERLLDIWSESISRYIIKTV